MRNLFTVSLLICSLFCSAQPEKCASQPIFQKQLEANPEHYANLEKRVENYIKGHQGTKSTGSILTIPVVFHVVYNPLQSGSNLSEATLKSQIQVLNEDYRRKNADAFYTREVFKSSGADVQIEFCLAKTDPQGNPSNGITRKASLQNFNPQTFENYVKFDSLGGTNAWPADQYLNIWTCDMSLIATEYVIGYAQFPGGDPKTDGVVLAWKFVGRAEGDSVIKGRTATHEIGHWLGLRHIWGDGDCTASDLVDDTPKAAGSNSSCVVINSCDEEDTYWNGTNPPDMVENYMDYTGDRCMNIFTLGQKARMHGFLYSDSLRVKLFDSKAGGNSSTASTNEHSQVIELTIYPNPSNQNITVAGAATGDIASITSLTGQPVLQLVLKSDLEVIDLMELPLGAYLFSLKKQDGTMVRKSLIRQ